MNLAQILKQLSTSDGREQLTNLMLQKLPQSTRQYLFMYKNNPMKGIEEGVRTGKITDKEIQQLKPLFKKARMFGIKLPLDKLNEIENLAKQNKGNNSFSIF